MHRHLLSPHFDTEHFISEALKAPDARVILEHLEEADRELKIMAKTAAVKVNELEIRKAELLEKAEAELLAVRESTAGLRSTAQVAKQSLAGVATVRQNAEIYAKAAAVSKLVRRLVFFASELKRLKLVFPELHKEDALPLEAAVRLAKGVQPLVQLAPDLTGVSLVADDLASLQKLTAKLNSRFARDFRAALKAGNLQNLAESASGLKCMGVRVFSDEVSSTTEELVAHVKRHGSGELLNTAAQAALLSTVAESVEPSRVFWQKTLARRPEPKYYALYKDARDVVEKVLTLVACSNLTVEQLLPQL